MSLLSKGLKKLEKNVTRPIGRAAKKNAPLLGAVAGSLLLPGVGTVLGGALGGAGGQMIKDGKVSLGGALKGGAMGALAGGTAGALAKGVGAAAKAGMASGGVKGALGAGASTLKGNTLRMVGGALGAKSSGAPALPTGANGLPDVSGLPDYSKVVAGLPDVGPGGWGGGWGGGSAAGAAGGGGGSGSWGDLLKTGLRRAGDFALKNPDAILGGVAAVQGARQQGRQNDLEDRALAMADARYRDAAPFREAALAQLGGGGSGGSLDWMTEDAGNPYAAPAAGAPRRTLRRAGGALSRRALAAPAPAYA